MIDATRSGGVVDEGAAWPAELVVEADAGGEREQACGDAGAEVAWGAGAVAFQAEQVFAGVEDRFDPLPDWCEVRAAPGFVAAGGAHDGGAERGDGFGELAAGVALVANDRLAAAQAAREQRQRDLALGPVGGDQRGRSRRAVERAEQVQAHAPEPARVAARVAVAAAIGQLRAASRLDRSGRTRRVSSRAGRG